MFSLSGHTILITGATGGMGQAIAAAVVKMGGKVVALGRNQQKLEVLRQQLGCENCQIFCLDLTVASERTALIVQLPNLKGVVHTAGIVELMPLRFIDKKRYDAINLLNYETPVFFTQELLQQRKIQREASIIFIASMASLVATAGNLVYTGTKGALVAVTRVMALELAKQKIRVNCVSPGMVETPLLAVHTDEEVEAERSKYPLGLGQPEDVAGACVYLLSAASRWITGTNLVLDGGFTCK